MKIFFVLAIVSGFNLTANAQFYYNFDEAASFYNRSAFLKSSVIQKEVLVLAQKKADILVDSFKIFINNYDSLGKILSAYKRSKWSAPVVIDSFAYDAGGNKTKLTLKYLDVQPYNDSLNAEPDVEAETPTNSLFVRSEYDSQNKVKKVFHKRSGYPEKLVMLVFYDDQNRVKKIDYAPESEVTYYKEYIYKKKNLKIYTNTAITRDCNETIKFNDNGQVSEREIFMRTPLQTTLFDYDYTYYENGMVNTETKKVNGTVYTIVTHYYYKN